MKQNIKDTIGYSKTLVIISLLAVVFSALGALFGELLSAVSAGLLAAIFVFENKGKRIFSIACSALAVVIPFAVGGWVSVIGVETVVLALTVYVCLVRGYKKTTCSGVITVEVIFFALLSLYLLGVKATGELSFNSIFEYYISVYEQIRSDFLSSMTETFAELEKIYSSQIEAGQVALPTEAETAAVFDSLLDALVSAVVIFGFLVSGITLKVYSAVALAITDKPLSVVTWRFNTSNLFAIFYGVLYLVSIFMSSADGTVSLVIVNLHSIFLAVYSYVGFRTIYSSLRMKYSALVCWSFIIVGSILLLSMFGSMFVFIFDVLSIFGIMMTISSNRLLADATGGKNDGDNKN